MINIRLDNQIFKQIDELNAKLCLRRHPSCPQTELDIFKIQHPSENLNRNQAELPPLSNSAP